MEGGDELEQFDNPQSHLQGKRIYGSVRIMAIRTEDIGNWFTRTWSDIGMMIERDGVRYDEAIDPTDKGRIYTETNEPIKGYVPMKYSTLSIKRELAALGKWDAAKALIEKNGAWDDYILANYLAETDRVFAAAKTAFVAAGILTQAQLNELLPKCVWTAE